nr:hypothetical protein [Pandoravirus massiliensis]
MSFGAQKPSTLNAALSTIMAAMEASPLARSDGLVARGPHVVRAIVDALNDVAENGATDDRAPSAAPQGALASLLDNLALGVVNGTAACETPPQHVERPKDGARPTAASPYALADRGVSTAPPQGEHNHELATVVDFVAALKSLPPGAMVSAGSDGVAFARTTFALCDAAPIHQPGSDMDAKCTKDALCMVAPLVDNGVAVPDDPRAFNIVRLLGGAVLARRLANALAPCALARPDALVLVDDRVVLTPFNVPCIDLAFGAKAVRDSPLNPFCLSGNRAILDDARRMTQSGAPSSQVIDALGRLTLSSVAAPVSLYRIEDRLYGDCDLLDAYPSMGPDVRDVLFCPVGAPTDREGVALYETQVAESVLAAAYGPSDARLGAARRMANDARARRQKGAALCGPPVVHRDVAFDAIAKAVDKHGAALVIYYKLGGCPHSEKLSRILDDVAADMPGVPVLTVEHKNIPSRQRPYVYPHIFVAKSDGHVVFCSAVRTKDAIVDFVETVGDPLPARASDS